MRKIEKKTQSRIVTIPVTLSLDDPKGGIGHFIVTPPGIPKPIPLGLLIKWSQSQRQCLEPTIRDHGDGKYTMPEINRVFSVLRGLVATTIDEGQVMIPDTKDWEGWLRVLEYWKNLVRKKLKKKE